MADGNGKPRIPQPFQGSVQQPSMRAAVQGPRQVTVVGFPKVIPPRGWRGSLGTVDPMNPPTLKMGAQGAAVAELQTRLTMAGFPPVDGADGVYGQNTANAVQAFQASQGFEEDGAGSQTWAALYNVTGAAPVNTPGVTSNGQGLNVTAPGPAGTAIAPAAAAPASSGILGWFQSLNQQQKIVMGVAGVGIVLAAGYFIFRKTPSHQTAGFYDGVLGGVPEQKEKCPSAALPPSLEHLEREGRPL